jgi:uncharacterized protein (TIGR00730 family)
VGVPELKEDTRHIVTVFGSSRPEPGDPEYVQAQSLGRELAGAGFTVCNGGYGGIMEASARGAKEAGGRTLGVVSTSFARKTANRWIDEVVTVDSLVDRMVRLVDLAGAYVILKGGTGTLLEFAAVWEFMNKRIMNEKPIVLLGEFWGAVVHTLKEELTWEGLEDCTKYVTMTRTPEECARFLRHRFFEVQRPGESKNTIDN